MPRHLLAVILMIATALALSSAPVAAQTYTTAELQKIARVKARVAQLGVDTKPKVIVRLEGGEQIKGTLSAIGERSFMVEESGTSTPTEIPYFQVKEIWKKPSTGQKLAIIGLAAGATVGALYGVAFLLSKCSACME